MNQVPLIVGIGGTTREGSSSELALRSALEHARNKGCETLCFGGAQLPAEIFDPSHEARSDAARALVAAVRRADGLIISTPSYHGGMSGLIKNAFDFVEDLSGDQRTYLDGRAVGCIVCAYGAQAMGTTLSSLRSMVHALRGWPTPYGATIMVRQGIFGTAETGADPEAVLACQAVADQVIEFARMKLNKPTN